LVAVHVTGLPLFSGNACGAVFKVADEPGHTLH
jgi:hypothetical protein